MTFQDEAPSWILDRITRLLEERAVTGRTADRIIKLLDDCDVRAAQLGHNQDINKAVKERIERDDK